MEGAHFPAFIFILPGSQYLVIQSAVTESLFRLMNEREKFWGKERMEQQDCRMLVITWDDWG